MTTLDLMISYLTHIPMKLPFYSREGVEKDTKSLAYLNVLFLSCFIMISLIAGCRGCKKATDPNGDGWDSRNISNTEGFSGAPSLGLDPHGNIHVAWSDSTPGNFEIYYTVKHQGQSWEKPINISNTSEKSVMPSLSSDCEGNVHVVWVEWKDGLMEKVMYSLKDPAGTWSAPMQISAGQWPDLPQIGVDDGGNVHVIWMEDRIYYTTKSQGGGWTTPTTISPHASWNPALCVTPQGYAHAVWEMSYVAGNEEIFYSERPLGGDWTEPVNISNSSQWYSWEAQITADGEENVYAVWIEEEKSTLYFSAKSSDGSWSKPDSLDGTTAYPGRPLFSSLVVDPGDALHLAWDRRLSNADISYMSKTKGNSWSEPTNISNTSGASSGPSLDMDAQGTVHIVWGDETVGNWEIFYAVVQAK